MRTCEAPVRRCVGSFPLGQDGFCRSPAQRVRRKEAARHHTGESAGRALLTTVRAGDAVALPCAEARLPALGQA